MEIEAARSVCHCLIFIDFIGLRIKGTFVKFTEGSGLRKLF